MNNDSREIRPIAHIKTGFSDKFGIPRQSGLVNELIGKIIFEPEFRDPNALREIEQYSHLWLIWGFSENVDEPFRPTIRPPRLGGNTRVGVFASRSPFRPNSLGLSVVKLENIELSTPDGPVLTVSGIDMLDGTPVYDIKPYLPYVESIPEASDGFSLNKKDGTLKVRFSEGICENISEDRLKTLISLLSQDPRPQYQDDPERIYKMDYDGMNISFCVSDEVLTVINIKCEG